MNGILTGAMQVLESELKNFILDSGLVSRKDVEAADATAKERSQSIGDVLVSEGALSESALRRIKAYVLGIPFVNLKDMKVPFELLSLIPEPIARTHSIHRFQEDDTEPGSGDARYRRPACHRFRAQEDRPQDPSAPYG
jgi:hypothetical protein